MNVLGTLLGFAIIASVWYSFFQAYEPEMDYKQSKLRLALSGATVLTAFLAHWSVLEESILILCFVFWSWQLMRATQKVQALRHLGTVDLKK